MESKKNKSLKTIKWAEDIISGFDWSKTRELSEAEKNELASKIYASSINASQLRNLYYQLSKIKLGNISFSEEEIFAIIMNIAMREKIGNCSYVKLLQKDGREIYDILMSNSDELERKVNPELIDIMMDSGKTVEELKEYYMDLGLEKIVKEYEDGKRDIKNLYMAKQVLETYSSKRKLKKDEKSIVLYSLLNNALLYKGKSVLIENLYRYIKEMGYSSYECSSMIINLALTSKDKKEGYSYSRILSCNKKMEEAFVPIRISEVLFQKALSENLTEMHEEKTKQELRQIGVSEEIIEKKDIKNLYMAMQIVDGYNLRLRNDEKKAVLTEILKPALLNKKATNKLFLGRLCTELNSMGLSKQKVYGGIMSLAINGSWKNGLNYTKVLQMYYSIHESVKAEDINYDVSEVDVIKAISKNLEDEQIQQVKDYYESIGIDIQTKDNKKIENFFVAKQIVEKYDFGRTLSDIEKNSILECIVKNKNLSERNAIYLITTCSKLKSMGLKDQEVYGAIINLAVNGHFKNDNRYYYSDILSGVSSLDKVDKDDIDTNVEETTIVRAMISNINENKKGIINEYYSNLGLERFIAEDSDEKKENSNLYFAMFVMEKIKSQYELNENEQKTILYEMLKRKEFNEESSYHYNLSTICDKFERIGLTQEEAYSAMVNLTVNGSVTERKGFEFQKVKKSTSKLLELDKDEIQKNVSSFTINRAVIRNLDKESKGKLIEELKEMGVNGELVEQRHIGNLYFAKKIVDTYSFGRELSDEEKSSIITCILGSGQLKSKSNASGIERLCNELYNLGLSDKEVCGAMIKWGINGSATEQSGYDYSRILVSVGKVRELDAEGIYTHVNESDIKNSLRKSERVIKRCMKGVKDKGIIEKIEETKMELDSLIEKENQKDNKQVFTNDDMDDIM